VNDYLLPEGMTPAAAGRVLAEGLRVRNGHTAEVSRTYYDTFDGLLYAQGLEGVWQDGCFSLAERGTGAVRARQSMTRPHRPVFAKDLEPSPLADALRSLLDLRALLPITEVSTRERLLDVLNSDQKTVGRIRLQWPSVGSRKLEPRLNLVGVRGYDGALERISRTVASWPGFEPAQLSLPDEAVMADGGVPGGVPGKLSVPLQSEDPAGQAAVAVLIALLGLIEANLEGTVADLDTEFLHDLRVSVRRSRCVQRELGSVFAPDELADFRAGFRWLQQVTGPVRDLDVWLLEFADVADRVPEALRPDLDQLRVVLRNRRRAARRKLMAALRSERAATLLSDWRGFLEHVDSPHDHQGPDAARAIGELAGERIRKLYRAMVELGGAIAPESPAESYHDLRKKGKELRYLLELFGAPLYSEDVVRPMLRVLKDLQDVLGRHQDREVQIDTLRLLAPKVGGGPGVTGTAMALGVLIERLDGDRLVARARFAERFTVFAAERRRRMVKEAFR
jgi:CHAD domain-containing protein